MCKWRVRWKKGVRYFTQNRTLSETIQISHAVLFRCLKQCSACFFPEACFLFEILRTLYAKKHIFPRASSRDLLLNEKQKKPFVSLNDGVTIIHESLTTASLAQVDKALNGPDPICFAVTPARYEVGKFSFFSVRFLYFFKRLRYLFKNKMHIGCVKLGTNYLHRLLWRRSIERQSKYHSHRKEMCSITAL